MTRNASSTARSTLNSKSVPDIQLNKEQQRAVFDRILSTAVPPVALGLAAIYVLFAVGHWFLLGGRARTVMVPLAAVTAVVFLTLWWLSKTGRIPLRWMHPVATSMVLLTLVNSLAHMALMQEIQQTSNLMLLIMAAGLFLLLRSSLLLVIITAVGGWWLIVSQLPPDPLTAHFSFGLPLAVLLAVIIQHVHRLTYLRMERLKLENVWRSEHARLSTEKKYEQIYNNLALPIIELDWVPVLNQVETLKARYPDSWLDVLASPSSFLEPEQMSLFMDANPAALELFGFESRGDMRQAFRSLMTEDSKAFSQQLMQALLSGKRSYSGVTSIRTRTGDLVTVQVFMRFLEDRDSKKALLTLRDITAEKQAEAALRASEERYQAFVSQSSEGIYRAAILKPIATNLPIEQQVERIMQAGVLVECNDAMARMYGLERGSDLVGQHIDSLAPGSDTVPTAVSTFIQNGYRLRDVQTTELDIHGNLHTFLNSVVGIVENGLLVGAWGIQRDITAEKGATDALRKREAQYQAFVAQSSEGIFRADLREPMPLSLAEDEQITWFVNRSALGECNDAMARMYGFERAGDILGAELHDLLPPTEDNLNYLRAFIRGGHRIEGAISQELDRDGTSHYIRNTLTGIIEDDHLLGAWGIQQDITEQIKAEEALRQTQRLESLGIMSSGIAHDFNNLLLAMMAQTSLAQANLSTDHPAQAHLLRAHDAAERGAQLTRQLLAFSGQAQTEPRPLDLNQLIRANRHLLSVAVEKNIELVADLNPDETIILGDVGQMQQVVMNLIINAAEAYNGRAGKVTITTRSTTLTASDPRRQTIAGDDLPPGNYNLLQVTDHGTGMDPDTLSRIFDPFFTTKFTGRGLGLAAVLGIVRGHNGGIQVESSPDAGSTFSVFLPVSKEDLSVTTAVVTKPPPAPPLPAPSGKVLIIDDDGPIRESIADMLALVEIGTLTAADGLQGLNLYRQHLDDIQLVILDLSMPNMSGQTTLAALREVDPAVQVLLSSGYSKDRVADVLTDPGVVGFLHKPYKAERLLEIVQRHLRAVESAHNGPDAQPRHGR